MRCMLRSFMLTTKSGRTIRAKQYIHLISLNSHLIAEFLAPQARLGVRALGRPDLLLTSLFTIA